MDFCCVLIICQWRFHLDVGCLLVVCFCSSFGFSFIDGSLCIVHNQDYSLIMIVLYSVTCIMFWISFVVAAIHGYVIPWCLISLSTFSSIVFDECSTVVACKIGITDSDDDVLLATLNNAAIGAIRMRKLVFWEHPDHVHICHLVHCVVMMEVYLFVNVIWCLAFAGRKTTQAWMMLKYNQLLQQLQQRFMLQQCATLRMFLIVFMSSYLKSAKRQLGKSLHVMLKLNGLMKSLPHGAYQKLVCFFWIFYQACACMLSWRHRHTYTH